MNDTGRPPYTDSDYQGWLDEMIPYLKQGHSLNHAIIRAGLEKHQTTIYEKSKLNDWFSEKIDTLRAYLGELLNDVFYNELISAVEAQKQGRQITESQWKNLRFMAEKHRSAQHYFVTRTETASARPIEELLDEIEKENENIDDVAETLKKQESANL